MLTDLQKKQLNKIAVAKLLEYIDRGQASFPEDFEFVDDLKKQQVAEQLANRPNPKEMRDWAEIESFFSADDDSLWIKLREYIQKWEIAKPAGNHLQEAKNKIKDIEQRKIEKDKEKEEEEWRRVDSFSTSSLLNYLKRYPSTIHKDEIDDAVWSLIPTSGPYLTALNEYLHTFPQGKHIVEANQALNAYTSWQPIKSGRDLISVYRYVKDNENSPFSMEANILLLELKENEIKRMKNEGSAYPATTLLEYIRMGLFTESELINTEVVTEESLEILQKLDLVRDALPNINDEIASCKSECAEGRTDVFFFGIPSTGKSCILMGLIGSSTMDVSYVRAGGPYAAGLQQYLEAGFTIGQTPKDFVATLEANIPNGSQNHFINLVEMAGEDFAFKLAKNPDGQISFKDMGAGAPELLSNNNRKAFFLIVDPTARTIAFNRVISSTDENGNPISSLIRTNVNQFTILKRMVDLFTDPENKSIMEKVDAIHIIVTKADVLGNDEKRDKEAFDLFMKKYQAIIQPLVNLCQEYGINVATEGYPKLYTFSLGNFYVGGIYQYDETDANKLVNVIKNNVWGIKKPSFIDKVRAIVNKPIF